MASTAFRRSERNEVRRNFAQNRLGFLLADNDAVGLTAPRRAVVAQYDDIDTAEVFSVAGDRVYQEKDCNSFGAGIRGAQSRIDDGQHFWARGYFVLTVGRDEAMIRECLQKHEKEEERLNQLGLWRGHPIGGANNSVLRQRLRQIRFERFTKYWLRLYRGILTVRQDSTSGNVSVRLGNGLGGFGVAFNYAVGVGSNSVKLGDVNGDGELDIGTSTRFPNNVSVLFGLYRFVWSYRRRAGDQDTQPN